MLIFISILLPIIAGGLVYTMFQQDLQHTKSIRKLKRGASEALIERHRRAIIIHFGFFLIFSILYVILFGLTALIVIVIWLIVFMGHMQALSRFSKQMMGAMEIDRIVEARIADAPQEDDFQVLDEDEVQAMRSE
ncbi:MAG: hypothetical protein Phog2KO_46340 [Phototrophicaceae bacterium]